MVAIFRSLRYCVYIDHRVATIDLVAIILFVAKFLIRCDIFVRCEDFQYQTSGCDFCSLRYCVYMDYRVATIGLVAIVSNIELVVAIFFLSFVAIFCLYRL